MKMKCSNLVIGLLKLLLTTQSITGHDIVGKDGSSFARLLSEEHEAGDIYQIVMGDSQFWVACSDEHGPYVACLEAVNCSKTNLSPETCTKVQNEWANKVQLASVSSLIDLVHSSVGYRIADLIIEGDLTQNCYETQLKRFKDTWIALAQDKNVTLQIGLGNHDYEFCEPEDAQRMLDFMEQSIVDSEYSLFDNPAGSNNTITNSLAYSWDREGFHFVQLNNFPFYVDEFATNSLTRRVSETFQWLREDLANKEDKPVIVHFHKPALTYDETAILAKSPKWEEFFEIIDSYNILGVFFAHFHHRTGVAKNHCKGGGTGESGQAYPLVFTGSVPGGGFSLIRLRRNSMATIYAFQIESEEKTSVAKESFSRTC